ncbi:MAG: hypothetical protein K0R90_1599 [Oscillospiraceae bacterium]|jgi:hypothetical protein|nr:hypothetical protein [Oscillospiraceae bacterium]
MKPTDLWGEFEKTGKIDDYLNYKKNSNKKTNHNPIENQVINSSQSPIQSTEVTEFKG